ncbi:ABC transporter substrate-binding protein [Kutzneria sp. CA-103260]|uniref:ABC transporter substrate-binding protein n=1 Tax=Kutzneria sp. CA-103260 TaxID=2802641 RepID=UPI001BAA2F1C|nr:ABC transporter substrate-binding protein [Kutzneria sp. CA-103260]QUQ70124.1 ABC transporter substrate-binding protein [Kutzneria sp. CA-103260]
MSRSGVRATLALPIVLLLAAGCGATGNGSGDTGSAGGTSSTAVSGPGKNAALAAMVPADVAKDGKLTIGTDTTYAPNEFVDDNNKTVGMDIDLGDAIAQELGLTADFQAASFDGILAGLSAGKFELAMSSFSVNADRLQTVDMVSYFTAGTSMAVLKGNPAGLTLDTLCGHTVAVQKGTTQSDDLATRSATCTQGGKGAITISEFQAQTDVALALTSKRADAMLADSPVVDYAVKQTNGQLAKVGASYANAPYGIGVAKNKGDFAKAVQGAVQALIDDGTYKKILDKWGVGAGAVAKSELNPATSS